jgi:hypothetical protein
MTKANIRPPIGRKTDKRCSPSILPMISKPAPRIIATIAAVKQLYREQASAKAGEARHSDEGDVEVALDHFAVRAY